MPVDLTDIYEIATRKLTLKIGEGEDDSITFRWSPAKYTRSVHEGLRAATSGDEQDPFAVAEASLVPLIVSWDVTSKGKPAPVTQENIASLGIFICQKMCLLLTDDMGDFREIKKDSDAG